MAGDELMSDPYASGGAPPAAGAPAASALPSFGSAIPSLSGDSYGSGALHIPTEAAPIPTPNFLFEEGYDEAYRRSWGERLTYHVGGAYMGGLVAGGGRGLYQGLSSSAGERQRIRVNAVLNATGKLGPTLGNSLGCVAMMCSIFESLAYNIRGEDDLFNPAGAAALTGMLYKVTSGPRIAVTWAAGLGAAAAVVSFAGKQASSRGLLKNFL